MGLTLPTRKPAFKVRKINRNNAVYGHYVWQVRFDNSKPLYTPRGQMFTVTKPWTKVEDYLHVRRWCEETFGPAMDYEFYYFDEADNTELSNPAWCFQTNLPERKYCIYLNDAAMTLFTLKWQ